MIHVTGVNEFVYEQVVEHLGRLEHGAHIETDHATTRARTPTSPLSPQLQTAIMKPGLEGLLTQPHLERRPCVVEQPYQECPACGSGRRTVPGTA